MPHSVHYSDGTLINGRPSFLERLLFSNRGKILGLFIIVTAFMTYQASKLKMEASFEKMIPTYHPYIANYLKHKKDLKGLGNVLWISVENTKGDIFDPDYLEVLQKINDEVFYIPGVNRSGLKSLWTPITRWTEVTEEGFDGGPVIPDTYDGSPASIKQLRANVMRSGEIGRIVANNFRSSIVVAPLMEKNYETGEALDYKILSGQLEQLVREKYESDKIRIHIVGFAKVVGDLIEGAIQVGFFFAITVVITMGLLYWHTRCIRCTLMPLICALVAVVWQAGMLYTLGYGLDPYSMLVPFLVFAIGVSHGVQMINAIKYQAMLGNRKLESARLGFRILYIPALCALVTDGIGFATLYVIRIGVLQDMGIGAAIRFPVLILAVIVSLPLLMSYVGVGKKSVDLLRKEEESGRHRLWWAISHLAGGRGSLIVLLLVALATALGLYYCQNLQIGDLDRGNPELRPDSRYNLDNSFIVQNYSNTSDIFVVMMETPKEGNSDYSMLVAADRLQWKLEHLEGVESTMSMVNYIKMLSAAFSEGDYKWAVLNRNQKILDGLTIKVPVSMANVSGTVSPIYVYLKDHKADTLSRVVSAVETFAVDNNSEKGSFLMAAGLAGIEAATNIEIEKSQRLMLLLVYGVVSFLVFLTFRSLRATICIIIPLMLTSLLCEVLMSFLGIGVKVATLPVISVGVGIGVDYGVYIYSRLVFYMMQGMSLVEAYYNTLKTTGKAVIFTGITLAVGVFTWAFSPIKFQADMGILLTFMFLWNMLGAVLLLPALVRYLHNDYTGALIQRFKRGTLNRLRKNQI